MGHDAPLLQCYDTLPHTIMLIGLMPVRVRSRSDARERERERDGEYMDERVRQIVEEESRLMSAI